MRKLCVIGWRPFGREPWYLRGEKQPRIYLPLITDKLVALTEELTAKGRDRRSIGLWVRDLEYAQILEVPILLTKRSYHPSLDLERFSIYPYDGDVLPTQLFRPALR